jgi:uncharacterized protein (DUF433 family)
VTGCR